MPFYNQNVVGIPDAVSASSPPLVVFNKGEISVERNVPPESIKAGLNALISSPVIWIAAGTALLLLTRKKGRRR